MDDSRSAPAPLVRRRARREPILLVVCIILLLLATIPPLVNLGRYQHRIAGAISRSIGRPVSMSSISFRLLPWPAFQIENLTVGEDPAFGAEPSLRSPEVIVEPRLSSLWRGRFELDRVEVTDASVNLVRNAEGRWNISSVLLQASRVPNAPTAQSHPGTAPRFPYIDATHTRINFKQGQEKLPYSLLDADFSMYLARPDAWHIRLQGQPLRTDIELSTSDTGILRLEGDLHRASELGTMPLSLRGEWNQAPLGQLSRLFLGRDAGWRGEIDGTVRLEGEIDHLDVQTHVIVANLHRQEFSPEEAFLVDATCQGFYSRSAPALDHFGCRWPLGDGDLRLSHAAGAPGRTLTLDVEKVQAGFVPRVLSLVRPHPVSPRRFSGEMNGSLTYDPAARALTGAVHLPVLGIAGAAEGPTAGDEPLVLHDVELAAAGTTPLLLLSAAPLPLGVANAPLLLSAELMSTGYTLHASGGALLSAAQAAAPVLHLPALRSLSSMPEAPATLEVALTSAGPWINSGTSGDPLDPASTRTLGTVHVANARWEVPWLSTPVTLPSLDAGLSAVAIRWSTPLATLGNAGSRIRLSGSADVPLHCEAEMPCEAHFALNAAALDAAAIESVLGGASESLFASLLSRFDPTRVHLPALAGTVHAGVLTFGKLPVREASLVLSTAADPHLGPVVNIQNLSGQTLGGTLELHGTASLASGAPHYMLTIAATGISAAQAAALWHENWGGGTLGGSADVSLAGTTTGDLLHSAEGPFRASWQKGNLAPALPHFAAWEADGTFGANGLTLAHGALPGTPATVSGTIGWDRSLNLEVTPSPGAPAASFSGTLAAPVSR